MIEHRHTKRVAISSKVSIYHRGTLVAKCKMKHISTDGMAIWAGPLQYHRNTMLEVEIKTPASDLPSDSPSDSPSNNVRLAAMVVYSQNKVLGLMFGRVNETAKLFLRKFVDNALYANRVTGNPDNGVWEPEVKTRQAL